MSEDLQNKLLNISEDLEQKDIQDILFLCGDKLNYREKESIKDGTTLFFCLQKRGLVSENDLSFLKEILFRIDRKDILNKYLGMTPQELQTEIPSQHISPYRKLLYDIAQSVNTQEVKNVVFVKFPRRRQLSNTDSLLDVLCEMEKDVLLSENNTKSLRDIMKALNRNDIVQKIEEYDNQGEQVSCLVSKLENTCIQDKSPIQPNSGDNSHGSEKVLEKYKLDKIPHGYCVIINNEDFSEARKRKIKLIDRKGTEKDAEKIAKVLGSREYTVNEHKNLTGQQMSDVIQKYGQENHSDKDSFLCFILSHGKEGCVYGTDGKEVLIKPLICCFNGKNCKSLVGKPKVFFIQACQGSEHDTGVNYKADSRSTYEEDTASTLPITADFLTAFASAEEYESYRDPETGTVYIQELCNILEDPHFFQEDLNNILTSLQMKIADGNYRTKNGIVKQMPSHKSELRKALVLPPKSGGLEMPNHSN